MKARALLSMAMAVLITCSYTYAASITASAEALTDGAAWAVAAASDPDFQKGVVQGYAAATGVEEGKVQDIMITHTNATLIPSMAALGVSANAGNIEATQMNNIWRGLQTSQGLDGAILNSGQSEQVMRILGGEVGPSAAIQAAQFAVQGNYSAITSRSNTILAQRGALSDKFGSSSSLASASMNSNFANRIWFAGYFQNQDMDTKDNYAGYKYKAFGGTLGYDHAFGPITAGAAFTYNRGDFEQKGFNDDNKVDNYGLSVYANYYSCSGFFADIYGGYNYGDNELKTWIPGAGQLSGDNHTNSYWAGGRLGYDFKPTNNFSLMPSVGIYYSHSQSSAYTASLNGLSAMNYDKYSNHGWVLPVELTAKYKVELDNCSSVTFRATGGYSYNLTNKGYRGSFGYAGVQDVTTTINGVKPGHSGWNAGAGIKYQRNKVDFSVDYRYDGRSKFDAHSVVGAIGINF